MNRTLFLWLLLAVVYGVFFFWYTSFDGPLTDEEIQHYLEYFGEQRMETGDLETIRRFMEEDTGNDFAMVNVIDLYDTPLQIEGVKPGETSRQVLDKYMAYMYPALLSRACHPVFFGQAAASAVDIMNADGMESWTTGALMRYRSRRDMLEISTNPEFVGSHEFKVAAMAKTIAFPVDPWLTLGDPRLLLALGLSLLGSLVSWLFALRAS